ncbi:hypothetical protein HP467_15855 [Curtobacterium albidum]|uniref:Uncharacterized protein n=1 Tax=Curtobacterium citreum TaxID=2036 RepID=A0A850DVA8_9MICO|nr:hypothetical protein [Curtobacterium albidum]NUU29566.1 hypothetical protein [Curtobacterium albidum]
MDAALWGQVVIAAVAVFGSVLGYMLSGLNDARRDRRTTLRERAARHEERDAEDRRERHAFQRATLLELQDAVQLMARLTGRTMHFDHMQAREGKQTQLPSQYDDEMHANGVDVIRLRNRLLDDDLRRSIAVFESQCDQVSKLPLRYQGHVGEEADGVAFELMRTFGDQVSVVMDAVGVALRANLSTPPPFATSS